MYGDGAAARIPALRLVCTTIFPPYQNAPEPSVSYTTTPVCRPGGDVTLIDRIYRF